MPCRAIPNLHQVQVLAVHADLRDFPPVAVKLENGNIHVFAVRRPFQVLMRTGAVSLLQFGRVDIGQADFMFEAVAVGNVQGVAVGYGAYAAGIGLFAYALSALRLFLPYYGRQQFGQVFRNGAADFPCGGKARVQPFRLPAAEHTEQCDDDCGLFEHNRVFSV